MATGCSVPKISEEVVTETNSNKITKRDEITCSLCLEEFKDPRILPCFHTYCKLCLDDLLKSDGKNGKFLCPLCRTLHSIPKEGGKGFPINYFMIAVMKTLNAKEETCSICNESSTECIKAVKMCLDCDQFLCQTCFNYHLKLAATKSHRIANLSEKGKMVKTSYCLKHKSEILRFFCKKCEVAICRDCKLTIHEGHSSVDIDDVSRDALLCMSRLITEYNSRIDALSSSNQMLGAYQRDLEVVSEIVKSDIENCLDKICKRVRKSGKVLQDILGRQALVKTKAVQKERSEIQKRIQASKKVLEHIEQIESIGSTADIINTYWALDKMKFKENELTLQEELAFPKWAPPDEVKIKLRQKSSFRFKDVEWISNDKYIETNMIQLISLSVPDNQNIVSICPVSDDHVLVLFDHRFGHLHNLEFSPFRRANVFEVNLPNEISEYCSLPNVRDITFSNNETVICYNAVTESFLVQPLHAKRIIDKKDCNEPSKQEQNEDPKQNTINNIYNNNHKSEVISLSCDRKEKIAVLYSSKLVEILCVSSMKVIHCRTLSGVNRPTRISCNIKGYYCISDREKEKVLIFDNNLKLLTELTVPIAYGHVLKHPYLPSDVCCNSEGAIFVSDIRNNCVLKFILDSNCLVTVSMLKMKISLDNPLALAIDSKNRLWVGDHNNRVCVFEF